MKNDYNISDFIEKADADGYVALKIFCNKVFRLSENDIGSFFDKTYRFYDSPLSKYARSNIRSTVDYIEITKKRRKTGETYKVRQIVGGIFKEDLEQFILQAKSAILQNSMKFDEISNKYVIERNLEVAKNRKELETRTILEKPMSLSVKLLNLLKKKWW